VVVAQVISATYLKNRVQPVVYVLTVTHCTSSHLRCDDMLPSLRNEADKLYIVA
jgi:hypothetical protein